MKPLFSSTTQSTAVELAAGQDCMHHKHQRTGAPSPSPPPKGSILEAAAEKSARR